MKFKTTKKAMLEGGLVIPASYCSLQSLLSFKAPVAYTAGVYGWNCDIYEVGPNWYIATGYRPFGNCLADYEVINDIESRAEKILHDGDLNIRSKRIYLDDLIEELKERVR